MITTNIDLFLYFLKFFIVAEIHTETLQQAPMTMKLMEVPSMPTADQTPTLRPSPLMDQGHMEMVETNDL